LAFLLPPDFLPPPPPADLSRFGRRCGSAFGSAAASMPEDGEGLGFLVDLDLVGVRRAMDGRREGGGKGEKGRGVGLGLYQCRPPRRGRGGGGEGGENGRGNLRGEAGWDNGLGRRNTFVGRERILPISWSTLWFY